MSNSETISRTVSAAFIQKGQIIDSMYKYCKLCDPGHGQGSIGINISIR